MSSFVAKCSKIIVAADRIKKYKRLRKEAVKNNAEKWFLKVCDKYLYISQGYRNNERKHHSDFDACCMAVKELYPAIEFLYFFNLSREHERTLP